MTPDQTNWDKGFWRGILRESDGTPSYSRVGSLLLLLGTLGWVTYCVLKNHIIPDLVGPGGFFTGGTLSLYGVNKGAAMVKNFTDKFSGNGTPNTNVPPQA